MAASSVGTLPLLRNRQLGMLPRPIGRQGPEQIIKLKRAGLAPAEDRLNDVRRD